MQKLFFDPTDFEIDSRDVAFREGTGISNLDGRLWGEMGFSVARFFGDEAMVRARIGIEARYLISLSEAGIIRKLSKGEKLSLLTLHKQISPKVYNDLRKIESSVRHDVITMTLMMKKLLLRTKSLKDVIDQGWVHWGLTSEDVDNLARTIIISNYLRLIYIPQLKYTITEIVNLADKTRSVVIPGKTHLQTAIPTILGKEIALFGIRLAENLESITNIKLRGKLTGAVGNLAAHRIAYPKVDWRKFSSGFVKSLGLEANLFTTQIEPKAKLIEIFQKIQNINSILIDLSQDMRLYIGFDWLSQKVLNQESGSSAMPQKVNPIDFENSQGNALFSNWILDGLIRQLPVSWLQRDLVDKTIFRNIGLPFGYSQIALISANKGLSRLSANTIKINEDLNSDWSSLTEAYQIILRTKGKGGAYNTLKDLSRGKKLTSQDVYNWISRLNIDANTKKQLREVSFASYTGYAKENCIQMIKKLKSIVSKNKY